MNRKAIIAALAFTILVAFLLLRVSGVGAATVYYVNRVSGTSVDGRVGEAGTDLVYVADDFSIAGATSATYLVNAVFLEIRQLEGTIYSLEVELRTDLTGDPSDTVLDTSNPVSANLPEVGSSFYFIHFSFDTPVTLTFNTIYWVVLRSSGVGGQEEHASYRYDGTTGPAIETSDVGSTGNWTTVTDRQLNLRVGYFVPTRVVEFVPLTDVHNFHERTNVVEVLAEPGLAVTVETWIARETKQLVGGSRKDYVMPADGVVIHTWDVPADLRSELRGEIGSAFIFQYIDGVSKAESQFLASAPVPFGVDSMLPSVPGPARDRTQNGRDELEDFLALSDEIGVIDFDPDYATTSDKIVDYTLIPGQVIPVYFRTTNPIASSIDVLFTNDPSFEVSFVRTSISSNSNYFLIGFAPSGNEPPALTDFGLVVEDEGVLLVRLIELARVADSFTDVPGTLLTAHAPDYDSQGGGWSVSGGAWTIRADNRLEQTTISSTERAWIDVAVTGVRVAVNFIWEEGSAGVVFRHLDSNNFWRCYSNGTDLLMQKTVSGSTSLIGSIVKSVTPSTEHNITVVVDSSNNVSCWLDGTPGTDDPDITTVDSDLSSEDDAGLYSVRTAATDPITSYDNFTVERDSGTTVYPTYNGQFFTARGFAIKVPHGARVGRPLEFDVIRFTQAMHDGLDVQFVYDARSGSNYALPDIYSRDLTFQVDAPTALGDFLVRLVLRSSNVDSLRLDAGESGAEYIVEEAYEVEGEVGGGGVDPVGGLVSVSEDFGMGGTAGGIMMSFIISSLVAVVLLRISPDFSIVAFAVTLGGMMMIGFLPVWAMFVLGSLSVGAYYSLAEG